MPADAVWQALISAASGLLGVFLGGWLTHRNQSVERQQGFRREQLSEFYSPMLGYREQLKARRARKLEIHNAAGSEWARLAESAAEMGTEATHELLENRWPEYQQVIDYDNRQLEDLEIPMFRQMLELFTSKMHLAEPSTRAHLSALVQFVVTWERVLTRSLPREVLSRIRADEEKLEPFYADLTRTFEDLQGRLKK